MHILGLYSCIHFVFPTLKLQYVDWNRYPEEAVLNLNSSRYLHGYLQQTSNFSLWNRNWETQHQPQNVKLISKSDIRTKYSHEHRCSMNPCTLIHDVCKSHLYLDVDQGKEKIENKNKSIFCFFQKGICFLHFRNLAKLYDALLKELSTRCGYVDWPRV
jgi:hypothetical protein